MSNRKNGTYGWGFVGSGGIVHRAVREIGSLPEASLESVLSRSQQRADDFAGTHSIPTACEHPREFFQNPALDIVYIGTPHPFHLPLALEALQYGKAVLCEKPLAVNAAEVETLIAAARDHRVFLMEAMWTRFLPVIQTVKQWLREGRVGTVQRLEADFGSRVPFDVASRIFSKELAGGALLDVGVYPVSIACFLLGRQPSAVKASGKIGATGVDEHAELMLDFGEGCMAALSASVVSRTGEDMRILGDRGSIVIPSFWRAENAELQIRGEKVEVIRAESGFQFQAREVMDCLRAGKKESETMPLRDSLEVIRILEKARMRIEEAESTK